MAVSKTTSDTKKAAESVDREEANVDSRIEALRTDIMRLSEALASFGNAKAEDYKNGLDSLAQSAIANSVQAFNSAKGEASGLEKAFEERVRTNPLQAVAIAAGIGFVAALLTRRS